MKERQRNKFSHPVHIHPGDTLTCEVTDEETGEVHRFTEEIGRSIVVDTVVTFDVDEPVLGIVDGIGAIFGTESKGKS